MSAIPRISRASVDPSDEMQYFWSLIEPIWPTAEVEDEQTHTAAGTPGQQFLYAATLFMREVDNGGLQQFLWNLDPWFADLTLKALSELGATEHATALRLGIDRIFGAHPPHSLDGRRSLMDAHPEFRRDSVLEELNERLYGEERLYPLFHKYVAAHPTEFFVD